MNESLSSQHSASIFKGRVAVLVDVQNMFYAAKLMHQSKLDYGRVLKDIVGSRELVRATAYAVRKPDVNQACFYEALSRFGYEVRIKDLRPRSEKDAPKASWLVGMTVDALALAPRLDVIVLVSGDGDLLPLVEALKKSGVRVEIVGFQGSTASELSRSADDYIPIQDSWTFKEKKFEQPAGSLLGLPVEEVEN